MSAEQAILQLQLLAGNLPGMKYAPVSGVVPSMEDTPFAMSWEESGNFVLNSAGWGRADIVLICEIHITVQDLREAINRALLFRNPFLKAIILDPTLGGTIATVTSIKWRFGRMLWNTVETVGYRFEISVKDNITVEA